MNDVTSLTLQYNREDAKTLVKAAFERTAGIETYYDDGYRIIGKTSSRIGVIDSSYGERVVVDISEGQAGSERTPITVTAEKEVEVNITADPEKFKSRFLEELDLFRGHPVDHVLRTFDDDHRSKEVFTQADQTDGRSTLWIVLAIIGLFTFFFMFMPLLLVP